MSQINSASELIQHALMAYAELHGYKAKTVALPYQFGIDLIEEFISSLPAAQKKVVQQVLTDCDTAQLQELFDSVSTIVSDVRVIIADVMIAPMQEVEDGGQGKQGRENTGSDDSCNRRDH